MTSIFPPRPNGRWCSGRRVGTPLSGENRFALSSDASPYFELHTCKRRVWGKVARNSRPARTAGSPRNFFWPLFPETPSYTEGRSVLPALPCGLMSAKEENSSHFVADIAL